MDDRYDRRALLLHLGDVLDLLYCLQKAGAPDRQARDVATAADIVDDSGLLAAIAASTTVSDLAKGAAGAYSMWPKQLLDAELNRNALAETVRHDLFSGNPAGWRAFCERMRESVAWFGEGVPAEGPEVSEPTASPPGEGGSAVGPNKAPNERRSEEDRKKSWPYVPVDDAAR